MYLCSSLDSGASDLNEIYGASNAIIGSDTTNVSDASDACDVNVANGN